MSLNNRKNVRRRLTEGFDSDRLPGNAVEVLTEYLGAEKVSRLIGIYNEYQTEFGDGTTIRENDEAFLDEMFSTPSEAVRAVFMGDFKYNDEYVIFNAYGNLETYKEGGLIDNIIIIDELASDIITVADEISGGVIYDILDEVFDY